MKEEFWASIEEKPRDPTKDLTEIVCIIDRSGSMATIAADATGGFNTFLDRQKDVPGDVQMTLVLFNDGYEMLHNGVQLTRVEKLTRENYIPSGMTALFDAIGKTVTEVIERHRTDENPPQKTIVCILTDGQENHSKEYRDKKQVEDLIDTAKTEHGFEFIYIGVGIEAFDSTQIGIPQSHSMKVPHSAGGMSASYDSLGNATVQYRTSGSINGSWNIIQKDVDAIAHIATTQLNGSTTNYEPPTIYPEPQTNRGFHRKAKRRKIKSDSFSYTSCSKPEKYFEYRRK